MGRILSLHCFLLFLSPVPGFDVNNRLMIPLYHHDIGILLFFYPFWFPANFSDIHRIIDNILYRTVLPTITAVCLDPHSVDFLCDRGKSQTGNKIGKYHLNDTGPIGVDHIFFIHHIISERRDADRLPPACLFGHTAHDFFGQIDAVIFVHRLDHRFYENGYFIISKVFGNGNNVNAELFSKHRFINDAVLTIPGKTGELPEKNRLEGFRFLFGYSDHADELGPFRSRFSADPLICENIFIRNDHIVSAGILADQPDLAVRAVFRLILRTDADIGRRYFHLCISPI